MLRSGVLVMALLILVAAFADAADTAHVVRYEDGRLTVRVTDAPLDRLLVEIASATRATLRGSAPSRTGSFDFTALPLAEALTRIMGAESFMLTYASGGAVRTIELLGRGAAVAFAPSPGPTSSAEPPLSEEERQAAILQRPLPIPMALANVIGATSPPVGRVLHSTLQEPDPSLRAIARETVLEAFTRDPEVEAAYLSTLKPVDPDVLAGMFRGSSPDGAAQEWMLALTVRARSPELRMKAAGVLEILQRDRAP